MNIVLILAGMILGGLLLQSFPGGVIVGGVFGIFAALLIKLSQRLNDIEKELKDQGIKLGLLCDEVERAAAARPAAPKKAAKAAPTVAKTVGKPAPPPEPKAPKPEAPEPEAPQPTVPPAKPVPPATPVPPAKPVPPAAPEAPKPAARPAMTLPPRPGPPRMPRLPEPSVATELVKRWVFGGNPLLKIGAVILFLGLAFALRYAAELGLLPLWLRYAAVAATGIALVVFGWRWRGRKDNYGLILQGTGIGVLYLTTLAAMKLHPLLPLGAGFVLLFLIAAFTAFLAVTEDAVVLAVAAALGGFAAPVLASTGRGDHVLLFSYLAVLNLGILAIAWFKRWRILNILGYVCSFGLGSAWAAQYYHEGLYSSTQPFLLLLFGIYVLITLLFARRTLSDADVPDSTSLLEHASQLPTEIKYVDGPLVFGVPFSAFWLQHLLVEPYQYGTAFSAMGFAAFYFLLVFLLIRGRGSRYFLLNETFIALGAIFATLSIPLLETQWTATAWAVEAAGVFWIGYRQQQLHTRLFALLVLLGSAVYFLPELEFARVGPVLDGPILSAVLLTAATGFTYWIMWRAGEDRLHEVEEGLRPFVVGFGAAMLATIPLLLLALEWASPALAIIGTGFIYLSLRLSDRAVQVAGWVYQLGGGVLFLATLEAADYGAVLADGWLGLLGTCLIGVAMLSGAVILAPRLLGSKVDDAIRDAGIPVGVALLAGLAFINLAPLFVLSWRASAMIWPVVGIATLVWAVHVGHRGVLAFSLVLQVIAGFFHLRTWLVGDVVPVPGADAVAFANSSFVGPALIAIAGLVCAFFMHRPGRREEFDAGLGWIAIAWGGLWWAFAWAMEVSRVVPGAHVTPVLIAVTLATAWAWKVLSQRLVWPQLGQAAFAYLPVLVILGAEDLREGAGHPGAGLGAIAWPAALVGHALLARREPSSNRVKILPIVHTIGAWLFIVLASVEVHWRFLQWAEPGTVWPLIGGMLVAAAYVLAITRQSVTRLWPVRDFYTAYVVTVALPLIIGLLAWLWFTNVTSNGDARPVGYVPVLNPLELAYLAVLAGAFLWWRQVGAREDSAELDLLAVPVLAGSLFAVVTGGVVRACHHWASIPWDRHALFASDTVQASLSIVWGALAISLMLLGNRLKTRLVWIAGATLVGVVVVKLFLVELSAVGTMQRIVSFIVVGLLLLLVGYIAPLPPRDQDDEDSAS